MIEMLGVLAIIGVLSVGGIAGYSKAMMKFKINKTVDQISTIVANTRTLFSSQKKYSGLNATIARKAHLIPDEMYAGSAGSNSWGQFENAFGGSISLNTSGKNGYSDNKAFILIFNGIPEEACIELATMDWGSGSSSGLIGVSAGGTGSGVWDAYIGCNGGHYGGSAGNALACPNGRSITVPMPVSDAASACNGNNNNIMLKYY